MTAGRRPVVAVVGGGIAGLAAAWELVAGPDPDPPEVLLLESSEAIGGKLQSAEFAGRTVDLAADAFLGRRPEATDLCAELGLEESLVPVGAQGASIWARGHLRPMPDGLHLGIPTRWWPLLRSGILSPAESVRVARDLVTPHLRTGMALGDQSVGRIVEERLGRPVVDRLVDPLIGGINAGGVDELSAAATVPLLLAAAHQPGSLMRRLGRAANRSAPPGPRTGVSPAFWSLEGSTAGLARLLAAALEERGVTIRTEAPVLAIERVPRDGPVGDGAVGDGPVGDGAAGVGSGRDAAGTGRWLLSLGGPGVWDGRGGPNGSASPVDRRNGTAASAPDRLAVDGVVLAVPAVEAAVLLALHAPVAAGLLSSIRYASVAVVTLSVPEGAIRAPLVGTGFLVPRTSTIDGRPPLITGVTYLGRKWPHLARPGDELIRASVGRFGDERHTALDDGELTAAVVGELSHLLDIDTPQDIDTAQDIDTPQSDASTPSGPRPYAMVTRWDDAFPQYEVGHLIRVARVEQAVSELDAMAVAGAALRGVGIPACIGSGRSAARRVLSALRSRSALQPDPAQAQPAQARPGGTVPSGSG